MTLLLRAASGAITRGSRAVPVARPRPPFVRGPVLSAALVLLAVLAVTSSLYGYHRDELYFRMLTPAWGYADQPPLTPLIVHGIASVVDTVWAIRIPAMLIAVASVVVVARITQEVSGGRTAQGLAAWGYAFADFTLVNGHAMFTATLDLLVWPLVLLFVLRATLRRQGPWLLAAGLVAGLSLYNKLLVAALLVSIVVALAAVGPRDARLRRWGLAAAGLVVVIGAPNLVYQAVSGWPQLAMGSALSAQNGAVVRPFAVPYLGVLLGPTLIPFWVAGLVALVRRPQWLRIRWLAVVLIVEVALVIAMGAQPYYDYGVLTAVYAVGCVPVADWVTTQRRRALVVAAVAVNSVAFALIALPLVPADLLSDTPVPTVNQAARDQIGWPAYVASVQRVAATTQPHTIVLTTNYGEAAAINRYDPALAARTYSGHNALAALPAPPADTRSIVTVGHGMTWVERYFRSCSTVGFQENGLGIASEEQHAPIRLCTARTAPMSVIWARAAHLR